VVEVASSNSTQYALLSDGTVYAWGYGDQGELGDGLTANSLTVPVQVQFPVGVKIAYLPTDAMPDDTAMAVDTDGNAWGWGFNAGGQLCLGNTNPQLVPVQLPLSDVSALAGAAGHALYDSHGTVYACGPNGYGTLGTGNLRGSTTPVEVSALAGDDVKVLVASVCNSGALLTDGTYFDWGCNDHGQLGDGTVGGQSDVPVEVPLPLPVTQVAQGGSKVGANGQTLVMLSDGSLRSWGFDTGGQLGDGATSDQASPILFAPPPGVTYQLLATGGQTSYAVSTTGDVYSWGAGEGGAIGNGSTADEFTPVLVESGVSLISATALDIVTNDDYVFGTPLVTSVVPGGGPLSGNNTMQIFGLGFENPEVAFTGVSFDPSRDTNGSETFAGVDPVVVSDTEIDVTAPDATGAADGAADLDTAVTAEFDMSGDPAQSDNSVPAAAGDNDYVFGSPVSAPTAVDVSGPQSVAAGSTYSASASAIGANPAVTYSLASGAPSWLSVDPNAGTITGTVTTDISSFTYAVTAINSQGSITSPNQTVTVTATVTRPSSGYWMVGRDGGAFTFGNAGFVGSLPDIGVHVSDIVGVVPTKDDAGYWMVGADGGAFAFGDAGFVGSLPGVGVHVSDIVAVVPSVDGRGYWLVGSDGGVFAFGDARYVGSLPGLGLHVNNIVGAVSTSDGKGYWMVGRDGGVFAFGDAGYVGSLPGIGVQLGDIVGAVPTSDNAGYWMVGSDGGVFSFGDAGFLGSLPGLGVHMSDIVGVVPTTDNAGYWMVGSDGGVFAFGDADFVGSLPGIGVHVNDIVGMLPT